MDVGTFGGVFHDGLVSMLLARGNDAKNQQGGHRASVGVKYLAGGHAVNPHHGGGGVAHHAARTAGVAGRHDRCQKADVHLALVQHGGHGAANHGSGDVVQKAGDDENQDQHDEAALPVIRQIVGQDGGNFGLLKMVCQQGKAQQQAQQVGKRHPLMLQKL